MTSKPRRDRSRTAEVHIYLTEKDKAALQKQADKDARSVNGQVLHYIRRGLEQEAQNAQ